MYVDDSIRLRHMLEAARQAVEAVQGKSRTDLDTNTLLAPALFFYLEVIGEAASRITKERQRKLLQIPWSNAIGMRNRLIHAYFDIDRDTVWRTVTQDLPPLIATLETIIAADREE